MVYEYSLKNDHVKLREVYFEKSAAWLNANMCRMNSDDEISLQSHNHVHAILYLCRFFFCRKNRKSESNPLTINVIRGVKRAISTSWRFIRIEEMPPLCKNICASVWHLYFVSNSLNVLYKWHKSNYVKLDEQNAVWYLKNLQIFFSFYTSLKLLVTSRY